MSSFKKRSTVVQIPGTRPSSSSSLPLLSTGLATIDDLLGGGLPLSASLVVVQDYPTSYSELVLRYFIAQGLESAHDVVVVAPEPHAITRVLMGNDRPTSATASSSSASRDDENREDEDDRKREQEIKDKMKIAFRYEGMKQHQTTLATPLASSSATVAQDETAYCSTFDLTTTRALSASDRERLHFVDVDQLQDSAPSPAAFYDEVYQQLETFVSENGYLTSSAPASPRKALRIVVSSLGSPSWGPSPPSCLYTFVHRLRALLRRSTASSLTTFPSHLYPSTSTSSGSSSSSSSSSPSPILTRISHASDAVLSLVSTSSSPSLAASYPTHQGLLHLSKFPSRSALVPPSTKLSLLRNLGGAGSGAGGAGGTRGAGENLLGFRVKRRRFVVEVVSDEPQLGQDEVERKQRERKRRVEEANRKDREEGGNATDVLLKDKGKGKGKDAAASSRIAFEPEPGPGPEPEQESARVSHAGIVQVEEGMRNVGIGETAVDASSRIDQVETSARASAFKKKKKGVRMGGVSFETEEDRRDRFEEPPEAKKKVSISAMLHRQPELLDF